MLALFSALFSTEGHTTSGLLRIVVLGLGVVIVAALVNRFAPQKRARIRRSLLIYLALLVSTAIHGIGWSALDRWVTLCELFTAINLVVLVIFDLTLPSLDLELPSIVSDIAVGLAYVGAVWVVLPKEWASHVLATSTVVGVVLTISLQTTLGNILGGIALQLDGSIHVGDWIQLDNGRQGRVREIRWRHTLVETRDWDTIIVPNASLLGMSFFLLGKRQDKPIAHRMWVYFNVDLRYSPTTVIEAVREALHTAPIDNVAPDPPPSIICYDFCKDPRTSAIQYAARYWLTDLALDDPTSSLVRMRIYAALRRAGIPLARPTETLFVSDEESDEARLAAGRKRNLEALRSIELFAKLNEQELAWVTDRLKYAPYTAGETITRRGAVAHWLYILVHGSVEVRARVDGGPARAVNTIEAPGFFGEMGLLTGEPRGADVVSLTHVDCYRLDKAGFEEVLHKRPQLAETLASTLAKRRTELLGVIEGMDAEARRVREATEQTRILSSIQKFFGLDD